MDKDYIIETINFDEKINEPIGPYNEFKDFVSLECWKKACEVKLFFYKFVIPQLPPGEKYSLGSQIRNAAHSITANIAEGYDRFHFKEAIQFFRIFRGSLFELKDHLTGCYYLKYIHEDVFSK